MHDDHRSSPSRSKITDHLRGVTDQVGDKDQVMLLGFDSLRRTSANAFISE
jgi:hypothetical protein